MVPTGHAATTPARPPSAARARGSRSVEDKASDILAMARSLVVDTASKRGGGRSRPPAGATTSKKRRPASAKRDGGGGDPLAAPVASAAQAMSQLRQHHGMTRLEEMVEAAMQASERAHAAAKAERWSPGGARAPRPVDARLAELGEPEAAPPVARAEAAAWSVDDVVAFVEATLRKDAYSATFRKAKVNGALLLRLDARDLEETLGVAHGLDRRRLQGAVPRLAERGHKGSAKKHDRALGGDAAAADDLDAYLGSLTGPRPRGRGSRSPSTRAEGGEQPEDGADSGDEDARLDLAGFRGALAALGRDLNAPHVREYLDGVDGRRRFLFLDFVDAYVLLFASEDPDLRMSTGAAAAIGDRVRLLKGGHRGGAAELKQKFDRFAVGDRVTGNEALQALTELGSTLPRRVAAAYFRDRGSNGFARDVTFFEFLRAFAALELEDGSREPKLGRSRSPSSSADSRASVDRAVARLARGAFDKPAYRRPLEPTARRTRRRERERHHRELARRRDRSDSDDSRDRRASRRRRSPSPDSPPARFRSRRAAFRAGDRVRAQYRGRSKFYPGKVGKVHADGTLDVDYDDGEREARVDPALVEARYRGRSKYYKGKIARARGDGTFDIDYDDGEKETRVLEEYIKAADSDSDDDRRRGGKLAVGDKVEARYKGRSKFYAGKIARVHADGTFDIDYDDGEKETRVEERLIRAKEGGSSGRGRLREGAKKETRVLEEYIKGADSDSDDDRRGGDRRGGDRLSVGDKVEARYRGRSKYYPGKIARVHSDGTFDIDYDDGEKERNVDKEYVKSTGGSGGGRGRLREGAKVEARYRGRSKYYKGKISRDRGDGTFDVDYDDGEKETRVLEEYIKGMDSDSDDDRRGGSLRVGDKVEAQYKGRSKKYPGQIARVHSDGTYDIDYDDGEKEKRVEERLIHKLGGGSSRGRLREGAKVEARYRGRSKYYKGKISRDRGDGTFDIDYDDGEKETRVLEEYIKGMDSDDEDDRRRGGDRLGVGDKVEARYRGRSKYYAGKIARVHSDGTFDIDYDDGEKERNVDKEYIKSMGGGSSSRARLREGAKVEARYRGRSKYYKGKISRDRGDGTFDIDYDDGEKETRVLEEYIKALGGGGSRSPSPSRGRLREGAKVEARYRGRSKFYPGKISRDGGGTFDIDYDDGEKETRVLEEYIKAVGGRDRSPSPARGSSSRRGRLREGAKGAKVEARYRGRSKYYKGKISRDRGDGTFDIDYDDGEKETRVLEEYIKGMDSDSDDDRRGGGKLDVGDKVEARYRGRSKFYPGKIARVRGDGTFDVDYDDGEKETRVLEEYIKSTGGSSGSRGRLREGAKVEARYRGRSEYCKGRIARDRGDGTFDIDYDDGEKETRVLEEYIKGLDSDDDDRRSGGSLGEGDKVEARYRGREKYYPGKISRDRGDGTFDIAYDDGERETRVEEKLIRKLGGSSSSRGRLREGAKVEARYRGRSKYYKGKISRSRRRTFDIDYDDGEKKRVLEEYIKARSLPRPVKYCKGRIARDRGDGTFDIDYDDGEKETRVLEEYIKGLDSDDDDRRSGGSLGEGDKVEARYRGREKYYPGKISRDRGDGTFDIAYDDGERETRVEEKLIRKLGGSSSSRGRLREGAKVEARYRGRSKYYKGRIARDRGDGTFDIDYDDGEKETRVLEEYIKGLDSDDDDRRSGGSLGEGDKVEARYRGREKYYPGKISRDRGDGTFDIAYDDGERETRVEEKLIRKLGGSSSSRGRLREGAKVEARYRGRSKYYKGKISRDRGDGTFDIDYDDGEKETRVLEEYIKALGGGGSRSPSPSRGRLREGAKVEARYRGRSKFYPGKISRDRGDGTFDIDYDDGEKETRVLEEYIKAVGGRDSSPARGRLREGAKVEARYRGRSKYYKGKISRDRGDGTFDIDYDDGEKETRVLEEYIKGMDSDDDRRSGGRGRLREGAKVEARYRGRSKYYPGRIARDRGDGTFDIDYDDGEKETRVLEEYIKGGDSDDDRAPRAEAGCARAPRGDGTFDVDYDDGEKETRVVEEYIKEVGGRDSSPARGRLREGAKVEARYRGRSKYYPGRISEIAAASLDDGFTVGEKIEAMYKGRSKWYPGRISRDRNDGTYDIDYDDGERETREGARVEARYRGRSKYYPGRISRDRGDGTFDIDYDDGEKETRVLEEYVKSAGGGGDDGGGGMRVGESIEARYRGRSKYCPGKIGRVHSDGTFDIDYDDGEKERGVQRHLIRSMERPSSNAMSSLD
ncbi:cytidine deaminase [Aureococcus anophagefferens]|nr:cytidine deaminase [Aureococcus anophagefferens]